MTFVMINRVTRLMDVVAEVKREGENWTVNLFIYPRYMLFTCFTSYYICIL